MRQAVRPRLESEFSQNFKLKVDLARAHRTIARLEAENLRLLRRVNQLEPASQRRRSGSPIAPRRGSSAPTRPAVIPRSPGQSRKLLSKAALKKQHQRRLQEQRRQQKRRLQIGMVALAVLGFLGTIAVLKPKPAPQSVAPTQQTIQVADQAAPPRREAPPVGDGLVHNVRQPPTLIPSQELQAIVDSTVQLVSSKGFKTEPLSITLIDLKTNQVAGFQNQIPRYPASVVKFLWMVVCFAQLEAGTLQMDAALDDDLKQMVINSDNDAASRVFDRITTTESGKELSGSDYDTWLAKRLQLNRYYRDAGYEGISITQKNYPIASIGLSAPAGRERQMVGEDHKPVRSLVSTDHAARLMYEVATRQAVSERQSEAMLALMRRDLHPEVWQKDPENSVQGFMGEGLPAATYFAAKLGMTSQVRHEVAFIESEDGKTSYILAVFGADPAYSNSGTILPDISRSIFTQMINRDHRAIDG